MKKLWEKLAIEKLEDYRALSVSAENLREQIAELESDATSIRSMTFDSQVVRSSGKQSDPLMNNLAERGEKQKRLKRMLKEMQWVERAMSVLSEEQRLILDRSYIHPEKGAIERLCSELGYEKTTIYKKREHALEKFSLAYHGE